MNRKYERAQNALYRLYDASGDLLYLGVSHNPEQRWAQHRRTQHWWLDVARKEVTWVGGRATAEAAELTALAAEKPKYDRHMSGIYRHEIPSTVRRHADPEAEAMIQLAVSSIGNDIRSGVFPPWSVMPSLGALSDRYQSPVMAVDIALHRLDFQEHLVKRLDGRSVVTDPRTFPSENVRGRQLTRLLVEKHFGRNQFTLAQVAERTELPLSTVAEHIRLLTREGAAQRGKSKGQYALVL